MFEATDKQRAALLRAGYTQQEISSLRGRQVSELLDYVARNGWKRPSSAQIDALVAVELNSYRKATWEAVFVTGNFSRNELKLTETPDTEGYIDCALSDLETARELGLKAAQLQGEALYTLKVMCDRKQWDEVLKKLNLSRSIAHRQMQLAWDLPRYLLKRLKRRFLLLKNPKRRRANWIPSGSTDTRCRSC